MWRSCVIIWGSFWAEIFSFCSMVTEKRNDESLFQKSKSLFPHEKTPLKFEKPFFLMKIPLMKTEKWFFLVTKPFLKFGRPFFPWKNRVWKLKSGFFSWRNHFWNLDGHYFHEKTVFENRKVVFSHDETIFQNQMGIPYLKIDWKIKRKNGTSTQKFKLKEWFLK